MFLKQYNYKPRQGSMSSQPDTPAATQQTSTTDASAAASAQQTAATAGRRRSSVDQKFAGLQNYKRSSMDAKKESFAEQSAGQPGVLGQMWNSFTKGK